MKLGTPIWPRFLPTATVLNIATLGPLGRAKRAPGTFGSAAGLLYQVVLFHPLGMVQPLWLGAVMTVLFALIGLWFAVAICGEAEFRLGRRDPGEVVLDEFVVMPLCFLGWPLMMVDDWPPAVIFFAGFALFRLFDIAKPLGIARLQSLPGGWGVVADDVAAALATCATLHAAALAWATWGRSGVN